MSSPRQSTLEEERHYNEAHCAGCGEYLYPGDQVAVDRGLFGDQDTRYHAECFPKGEWTTN